MSKEITKKIISGTKISINELTEIIASYLEDKGKSFNSEQLNWILQALNLGIFNLEDLSNHFVGKYNLSVLRVHGKNGELLKTIIT